ncbi:MAG: organomercurial lyase [Gemmatimonadota bacterium]
MFDATRLRGLFAPLSDTLPDLESDERSLALELYALLSSTGKPVSEASLARATGFEEARVRDVLSGDALACLIYRDDDGRIAGFGGLAVLPMAHRLTKDGTELYAWCAWDALFLPTLLGGDVEVKSTCPTTGESISLTVGSDGARDIEPAEAVISFLVPEAPLYEQATIETITRFCHFVHFFRSREAAEKWTAHNPGTFVLSVDEGFELGRLMTESRFGLDPAGNRPGEVPSRV